MGVTGTKGKSTTVELINAILEAAGYQTALISSLRFKIGGESAKNDTSMTMPGRFFIQRFLRKAVNKGCQYALLEVTSQGILQHRHRFIDWNAALMTNVKPEHIEAHGSFENYRNAKTGFFSYISSQSKKPKKLFFINDEDQSKEYFSEAVLGRSEVIYYSRENLLKEETADLKNFLGDWLLNRFNLQNAAAAASFAYSQGVSRQVVQKTFLNFKGIPGRMEIIQENPFKVIIDYAHTPDSLAKVYETLQAKRTNAKSRLICLLGAAGGGRDKWKRPILGKIASNYCRHVILTDEDSYDDPSEEIISQIESGIINGEVYKILDRREAIAKALSLAKKGDTVILTGKGSESWIHFANGKKISWDEKRITEELLAKIKK